MADVLPDCAVNHPGVPCLNEGGPGSYCAPRRCYCGSCPWYVPIEVLATNTPDTYTAFDRAAILSSSGRRASLAEYRAAQEQARR